jgi:SAM-dependent methyltransferase
MEVLDVGGSVGQVLRDYDSIEPGDSDTFDPVERDGELAYRLALLDHAAVALRYSRAAISDLRVLDFGCGNGRSTRMYLDLGLFPEQVVGVDVRRNAIERARKLNPAIRFETEVPTDFTPNWLSLSTVFSSILSRRARLDVAGRTAERLAPLGHVFYLDLIVANDFAGADSIGPACLFPHPVVWSHRFSTFQYRRHISEREPLERPTVRKVLRRARRSMTHRNSHECFLFRKT